MSYTSEQILRISANRQGVSGKTYIQTNGDTWVGNSDGRLVKRYTADLMVSAQPDPTKDKVDLRTYLQSLINEATNSNVAQVEVDFGDDLYTNYKIFTISDSTVAEGAKIIANIAYDAPTDKSLDEIEMDEIICTAGNSRTGSFDLIVKSLSGSLRNKFKVNYSKTWQL